MAASVVTEISVKGKLTQAPSICIDGRTAIVTGGWLKTVVLKDENLIEGEIIPNPVSFIEQIKKSDLNADILTFPQKLSDTLPKYDLYFEWDNWAVVSITTYQDWLDMISSTGRKIVKKSQKLGVIVKVGINKVAYGVLDSRSLCLVAAVGIYTLLKVVIQDRDRLDLDVNALGLQVLVGDGAELV